MTILPRRRNAPLGSAALVLFAIIFVFSAPLQAQVVSDPRIVEFDPSPDHWTVRDDGQAAVIRYELLLYQVGDPSGIGSLWLGKPWPDSDGKIRQDVSWVMQFWTLGCVEYEARVRAVGPDGAAESAPSNAFTFTTGAGCVAAPGTPTVGISTVGGAYMATANFAPSPDQWAVRSDGQPAILRYELLLYKLGDPTGVGSAWIGKPSAGADGLIHYDFSWALPYWPLSNTKYEARISAVGPDGEARSGPSNTFAFTTGSWCPTAASAPAVQVSSRGSNYTAVATFAPSPDQRALLKDGQPAVLRYELLLFRAADGTGVGSAWIGKPSASGDGLIHYDFSWALPYWSLGSGQYLLQVNTVGPYCAAVGGFSNTFSLTR